MPPRTTKKSEHEIASFYTRLQAVYEHSVHFHIDNPFHFCDVVVDKDTWDALDRPQELRVVMAEENQPPSR